MRDYLNYHKTGLVINGQFYKIDSIAKIRDDVFVVKIGQEYKRVITIGSAEVTECIKIGQEIFHYDGELLCIESEMEVLK